MPANQVIGFELGTGEEMSRVEYDGWLARPLAHELESRKLWRLGTVTRAVTNATDLRELRMPVESKIRYVVLCFGVPLKIRPDTDLKEAGVEQW